jgi:hypothetical protein
MKTDVMQEGKIEKMWVPQSLLECVLAIPAEEHL